ncbi:1,4-dihydroxy-2-naphthoate prenyltransferase [Longilinea arvoryzae]|uniref:1,4-dihydroxy-2-naphthoate octaprenyltransferase n=1 Tax=Longilinea arvoryzae TaxID=360412 RepID=A0A0S7BMR2_9CHLR|nr:1,4-dihydroxy-2-naphthoate polyprenyltransferase [Longilinea arvoryzae]GAP15576.1 1,4-dihydroxy-2-naphthoate prenyltransferase [Longilinea arvoryzae]
MEISAKPIPKFKVWLLAARPRTLPAAAAPVIIGAAIAFQESTFRLLPALGALAGALLLQIGANFANDVFDYQKGADTTERMGPTRVTLSGMLSPAEVKAGMWTMFSLAALVGVYLTLASGWPVIAIGLLSIAAAILYTGGPFPYGYRGLGELFVFLFFGLAAVVGTYYVQAVRVSIHAIIGSVPVGLLIVAILAVNNLRDLPTDRATGKTTLAVRLGEQGARQEFMLLVLLAYLVPLLLTLSKVDSWWMLLPFLTLPMAIELIQYVNKNSGKPLNRALARTGQLTLLFSFTYAAGVILSRLLPL